MTPTEFDELREGLSDEDLDALAAGTYTSPGLQPGQIAAGSQVANVREELRRPTVTPDTSQGMSGVDLFRAGMGGEMADIGQGLAEKARIAFRPRGELGEQTLKDVASERAERKGTLEALYSNPAAVAGKFGTNLAIGAAAPSRLGAQMVTQGAMEAAKPGVEAPGGLLPEMINSLWHGAVGAGATGVAGKGLQILGKTASAATGKMTDEGVKALNIRRAAENLDLPRTDLSQLYPNTTYGRVSRALPAYEDKVLAQASALGKKLDKPLSTPEGDIPNVGAAYIDEVAQAAKKRMEMGGDKYKAVDEFVQANGLGNFKPMYTARSLTNTKNPGYEVATDLLERYGFDAKALAGQDPNFIGKADLTFDNFHSMRVAANQALSTLNRGIATAERMGTSIPAENRAAKKFLSDFKTALESDADRWAAKHESNTDAYNLYKDATKYYRDVVAPTVLDNPVARKAMSTRSSYKTGHEGLSATTSEAGSKFVDRLLPTMSQEGLDMNAILRGLPDVRKQLMSPDPSNPSGLLGLYQLTKGALAPPLRAVQTAISPLTESAAAAKLVGAKDVLRGQSPSQGGILQLLQRGKLDQLRQREFPKQGLVPRSAWGAAQYPQEDIEETIYRLTGSK